MSRIYRRPGRLIVARGSSKAHYDWRHGWVYPQRDAMDPRLPENRARWLAWSRQVTTGDRTATATTVRLAFAASFRLVDVHGRAHGPRYTSSGENIGWKGRRSFLVQDKSGKQTWLDEHARCRIVDAQPEDLHSRFSRMLKAEFKRGRHAQD